MTDEPQDTRQVLIAAGFFALVAALGCWSCFGVVRDYVDARASGGWPTVEGVVLSGDGDGDLRYAYMVGGRSYESGRVKFVARGPLGRPPPATPGALVDVYVKPEDPSRAVLAPGGSGRRFALRFLGTGVLVFFGVAGLIRSMLLFDFPELARETGQARTNAAFSPSVGRATSTR